MLLPNCHFFVVTILSLPNCHFYDVTNLSLPHYHFFVVTNLALPNCHFCEVYQIVITKLTLPKICPSSNHIFPSTVQWPGGEVPLSSQSVSESSIVWNRLVQSSTPGVTWSLEYFQRRFCYLRLQSCFWFFAGSAMRFSW